MKYLKIIGVSVIIATALVIVLVICNLLNNSKTDVSNKKFNEFSSIEESTELVAEVIETESDKIGSEINTETTKSIDYNVDDETVLAETEVPEIVGDIDLSGINLSEEDINSIIFSYGDMFGLSENEIHFQSVMDNGENYEIEFTDNDNKSYKIIITHDKMLVKVIRPE